MMKNDIRYNAKNRIAIKRSRISTRIIASASCMILIANSLAGCGAKEDGIITQQKQEIESKVLETVLDKQINRTSQSDIDKEESVYVLADSGGNTTQVIVSNWLKNTKGSDILEDTSDLENIVNLKGDESCEKDGSKLMWNAKGADIHYQGNSSKQLPVDIKLTYYLEGEEIEPKELAGKSGNVKIRFDYNNKEMTVIDVDGESEDIQVPFTVVSAMILPNDRFSDIQVTNGRVLSEGDSNIVVGLGFPGLKDSLKLDDTILGEDTNINIPDYVEVSAYAQDFELDMTMSVVMSDVLSDVSLTDDIDLGELTDSMDELSDASTQLVDGSRELKDGVMTLSEKSGEFGDGIDTLNDGIIDYTDGVGTLRDGIITYTDGVAKLSDGITTYTDGVAKLGGGITSYTDGVAKLSKGIKSYTDGVGTLSAGILGLKDGAISLNKGAEGLAAGAASAKAGVEQLIAGYEGSMGAVAGAEQISGGLTQCYGAVQSGMNTGLSQLSAMTGLSVSELTREKCVELAANALSNPSQVPINPEYISSLAVQIAKYAYMADAESDNESPKPSKGDEYSKPDDNGNEGGADLGNADNVNDDTTNDADADDENTADDTNKDDENTCDKNVSDDTNTGNENISDDMNADNENASDDTNAGNENASDDANIGNENVLDDTHTDNGNVSDDTNADNGNVPDDTNADNGSVQDDTDTDNGNVSVNTDIGNAETSDKTDVKETSKFEKYVSVTVGNLNEQQQVVAYVAIAQIGTLASSLTPMFDLQDALSQLDTGATALSTGISRLYAGTVQLKDGLVQLNDGAGALYSGTQSLTSGADKLAGGAKELDKASGTLKNGTADLTKASTELKDGVSELTSASGTLKDGSGELTSASGTLKDGTNELTNASVDLRDGADKLADGKGQLIEGIDTLADGAVELNDGMIKFDEEGISKLTDGIEDGTGKFTDRINAIIDAGKGYESFTGLSEGQKGSVKFIIKTDAVK